MTWFLVQQVADTPPLDWAQVLGSSGPLAGAALLLGYLGKLWIDTRREKREEKKADLEGEVGAVAAAREAVSLVREQMQEMKQEIAELRLLRDEDGKKIDKLEQRVRELETENEYLKGRRGASG